MHNLSSRFIQLPAAFFASAFLALATRAATNPESFVYRGSLSRTDGTSFTTNETHTILFTLYRSGSSTALWQATVPVLLSSNGLFQIELSDSLSGISPSNSVTLATLLANGDVASIGLSVDGESELFPRQEFVTVPLVEQARNASRLDATATAGSATATTVKAASAEFGKVIVNGTFRNTSGSGTLAMDAWTVATDTKLTLKAPSSGGAFTVFRSGAPEIGSVSNPGTSTCLLKAAGGGVIGAANTRGGFLVLISMDNWAMPCLSIPVSAGADYYCPFSCSGNVHVYFYPFGN